jgi:hypothetical protein
MKELLKIAVTVIVALAVYDMFIKKFVLKSTYDSSDDEE